MDYAIQMQILPGSTDEYRRRHEAIWPELVAELHAAGVRDYRIYAANDGETLFATISCDNRAAVDGLATRPVMQRWWVMMADIMVVNSDRSPIADDLLSMFDLATV